MALAVTKCKTSENNFEQAGFGIYVHWPYCRAKCPYCDFNSHVRAVIDQQRWCRALLTDMRQQAKRFGNVNEVRSIFFGGGTPSLMPPATVGDLIDEAARLFRFAGDIEITLEANPTSVEAANFNGFAQAGVNRVSLGVQSLDDDALRFLGREHSAAEALAAIDLAHQYFDRSSFDLIYARAGQTPQAWAHELDLALKEAAGHISLYQLTIEPGTKFHAEYRAGRLPVLANDAQAQLFEQTIDTLAQHGFDWYEISNFAKQGEQSRHNLIYWRYGDYMGIGPGAHGRLTIDSDRIATMAHRAPDRWLDAVAELGHGLVDPEPISPSEAVVEALMMGLRLDEGVQTSRLAALAGPEWGKLLDQKALTKAEEAGFIQMDDARLTATASGRQVLDSLLAEILAS